MAMEFRWVKRYVDFTPEAWKAYCQHMLDPDPPVPTQTVLQFRDEEGPRGETWWGEWKDVPYVDMTK
jgi:hypothetical protein